MSTKREHMITLQLVVGVLFVVISGAIFVSSAWEYIPAFVKQGIVAMSSIGCFVGCVNLTGKGGYTKVRTALYYLGACFGGLFLLSLYTYIGHGQYLAFAGCVFVTGMSLYRLWKKKEVFDYVMSALFTDATSIFGLIIFSDENWLVCNVVFGVLVLIYAGVHCYLVTADPEKKRISFRIANLVFYILHGIEFAWQMFTGHLLYWMEGGKYTVSFVWNLAVAGVLAYLLYRSQGRGGKMTSLAIVEYIGWQLVEVVCEQKMIAEFEPELHAIVFALGIVLLGHIWYDKKKGAEIAQLSCTVLLFTVWGMYNLETGSLLHVLILGVVTAILLGIAVVKEKRGYAMISGLVLLVIGIRLTWNFWCSIAWWVYLFAVGVAMIIMAIRKERKR